jgi:hypothetical protein
MQSTLLTFSLVISITLIAGYAYNDKMLRCVAGFISAMGMIFIIAFRGEFGDYLPYKEFYENAEDIDLTRFEIGWVLLNNMMRQNGIEFHYYVFFISIITVAVKYIAFMRLSPYPLISLYIFLYTFMWADLGQMRSGLSFGLFLLSLTYLLNGNHVSTKKRITTALLSLSIHYSVIILICIASMLSLFQKVWFVRYLTTPTFLVSAIIVSHFFNTDVLSNYFPYFPFSQRLIAYYTNSDLSFSYNSGTKILYSVLAIVVAVTYLTLRDRRSAYLGALIVSVTIFGNFFSEIGVLYMRVWGVWLNGLYAILIPYYIKDLNYDRSAITFILFMSLVVYGLIMHGGMYEKYITIY